MDKTIFLVRHAKAEEGSARFPDFERELISAGIMQAARMGKKLAEVGIRIDQFITSPAPRAAETARIFAEQLAFPVEQIVSKKGLYDGGPRAYLETINTLPEDIQTVVLFGHNPDITFFGEYLTKQANGGSMDKASWVQLRVLPTFTWAEVDSKTCEFVTYQSPKQTD